ncbi:MAG: hypothetical protein FJW68_05515 [Actinobacteria bacterium]|nr:hypothetical protein [Actinomycetota bacterium]
MKQEKRKFLKNKFFDFFKTIKEKIISFNLIAIKPFLEAADYSSEPFSRTSLERLKVFKKRKLYFSISLIILFLLIYGMLFFCFPPHLLFRNTTTNGGDMGAHNYIAKYFIEELFPDLRMTGWDTGWFAGMPMLTFYFPLPYLLIAILSKVFAYNIAFKLVTVLGSLMLPAALYLFAKLFRFKYPFPEFAAIGAMAFLYMKSFKIYGANFLGTFAGEFSYSISFALVFIFIATLYRGIERGRFDWLFALNSFILASIVLTHLITLIALLIIAPCFFVFNRRWKCARYIIAVFATGFFLSAFWSVPFVLHINYTPQMLWTNIKDLKEMFPLELLPALVLAVLGIFFSTIKRDKKTTVIMWTLILFMSLFFTWDGGRLYNARFLPIIFTFIYLAAAYGISSLYWIFVSKYPASGSGRCGHYYKNTAQIIESGTAGINFSLKAPKEKNKFAGKKAIKLFFADFKKWARSRLRPRFYNFMVFAFVPIIAFLAGAAILAGNPLGPAWARHNFTGFEEKEEWQTYNSLMTYLDSLPYGRVMFEFDKEIIQKYGTPRSFELIPFWTSQAGMEGLLVESSITAPFHYINQAELSVKPRGTVAGWKTASRNYYAAIKHLKFMNITYIMASSPEVIEELDSDSSVVFLNKIEPYYFYEIAGENNYVEVMANMPYRYSPEENWILEMRDWYLNPDNTDNPVVRDDGSAGLSGFKLIDKKDLGAVPDNPFNNEVSRDDSILYEHVEREKITFTTTAVGVPHLVKMSYFPNWQAKGADGPYLVSPSFMMVIPTDNQVTLYYGMAFANKLGAALTSFGWAIIAAVVIINIINSFKNRKRQ